MKRLLRLCMLLVPMALGITSCTDTIDNPSPTGDNGTIEKWYSDVSGKTSAVWNYGKCWQVTEFKADGKAVTDIYYMAGDEAVAREHRDLTYTASDKLTMTTGMLKMDADMEARVAGWAAQELLPVSKPARYTVFLYGNAGGQMDNIIEDCAWDKIKPLLTDSTNVRMICFYKYGAGTNSKYGSEGDIVWFELNSETDLNKIREEGLQSLGLGDEAISMKLCEPDNLSAFIQFSSLMCPAEKYVFTVWGHGTGFVPTNDVPGKYDANARATRGVLGDEWNEDEELDMYELTQGVQSTGRKLDALFLHNCLLGNLETLTQARSNADYIFCSTHPLAADQSLLLNFIKALQSANSIDEAGKKLFELSADQWHQWYVENSGEDGYMNGDYKMIRTDRFDAILDGIKLLVDRLLALYPTQKEAIDLATRSVYRFTINNEEEPDDVDNIWIYPMFDIADYAHLLAANTGDAELSSISQTIDKALQDAIPYYADVNLSQDHLEHYTLSVCLYNEYFYTLDLVGAGIPGIVCNIDQGYEQCDFHKLTGWGNWLRANQQVLLGNPRCGNGGPIVLSQNTLRSSHSMPTSASAPCRQHDLQGRLVNTAQRGIYTRGGRKFIRK